MYNYPTIRLFDEIFGDFFDNSVVAPTGAKTPIHDVIETDKEYIVEMLMAGVKREDIDIDVDKSMLTITAERKENKDLKYNRKETYFGEYKRAFKLPDNVDKEKIDATLSDGILRIVIPKIEIEKITIEIK